MSLKYEEIEKYQKKFEERVIWLSENIPPDDIYCFAQQMLLAAEYFIYRLNDQIDVREYMASDIDMNNWVKMVLGISASQMSNKNFFKDNDWKNPLKS